ncbi:MAG TPA: hypothetical protein VGV15_22345 [Terriglobales bacterium]|nr:hypothetical protein [Terriglobales bacterium]
MSVAGIASNSPFQPVNQAFFFQRRLDVVELGQAINSGDLPKAQQVYDTLTALGQNTDSYKPFKSPRLEKEFLAVGQALQTGDEAAAQKAYATLQQDIQKINFRGRRPSEVQPRVEEIILDLIQAQASNNTTTTPAAGAGSDTAPTPAPAPAPPPANNASTATPAASTPEIVINIDEKGGSQGSAPEIVLNLASQNSGGSSPELTIDINTAATANGASSSSPEIVLNLGSSSPEIAFNFANSGGNGASLAEIVLNLSNGGTQPQTGGIQINVVA